MKKNLVSHYQLNVAIWKKKRKGKTKLFQVSYPQFIYIEMQTCVEQISTHKPFVDMILITNKCVLMISRILKKLCYILINNQNIVIYSKKKFKVKKPMQKNIVLTCKGECKL